MDKKKKNYTQNSEQSSRFIFWIIGFIVLCVVALIFLSNNQKQLVEINYQDQPYLGQEGAPVQIVEFGDYKCPACKNFNENIFPQIKADLVDTGKAQFYFINYPFINIDSTRSAQFAEAIYQELGNEAFWNFHKLLYEKQPSDIKYENMDYFTDAFLQETLGEVVSKENVQKVVTALETDQPQTAYEKDMGMVNSLAVTGTPTIMVNGKSLKAFLMMI